jgi:hypothetical protein
MKSIEKQKVFLRLTRYFSGDITNGGLNTYAIPPSEKLLRNQATDC